MSAGTAVRTPETDLFTISALSTSGVWYPKDMWLATKPATSPEAIDVPEPTAEEFGPPVQADWTKPPGATTSTQDPKFEKLENSSPWSLEATVIAAETEAGEVLQASAEEFPAATTNTRP